MGKAGNWTICPRERWLMEQDMVTHGRPSQEVIDRGALAEDLVAQAHKGWQHRQYRLTLPTGRKGYCDMLDEQGGPVEVKGLRGHTFEKLTGVLSLAEGYKYQMEYVVQLAGYCVTLGKKGRFVLVNMDSPTHEMKEFEMPLDKAKGIWSLFVTDQLRPSGCVFCNVEQGCKVASKLLNWGVGFEIKGGVISMNEFEKWFMAKAVKSLGWQPAWPVESFHELVSWLQWYRYDYLPAWEIESAR